jgi:hypothetical protein
VDEDAGDLVADRPRPVEGVRDGQGVADDAIDHAVGGSEQPAIADLGAGAVADAERRVVGRGLAGHQGPARDLSGIGGEIGVDGVAVDAADERRGSEERGELYCGTHAFRLLP